MFLETSQNSQEFAEACNFIKKETLAQVISCEFYEIFKNNFLTEHLRTAASQIRSDILIISDVFVRRVYLLECIYKKYVGVLLCFCFHSPIIYCLEFLHNSKLLPVQSQQ